MQEQGLIIGGGCWRFIIFREFKPTINYVSKLIRNHRSSRRFDSVITMITALKLHAMW